MLLSLGVSHARDVKNVFVNGKRYAVICGEFPTWVSNS